MHTRRILVAVGALSLAGGLISAALAQPDAVKPTAATPKAASTLYDRLGGTYPIAAVVDAFFDRLAKDPVVLANPRVKEALTKARIPGLRFQTTAMVIQVTGGPYQYQGQGLGGAHKHLLITEAEWNATIADLTATLEEFKVPTVERDELIDLLSTTKSQIVAPDLNK